MAAPGRGFRYVDGRSIIFSLDDAVLSTPKLPTAPSFKRGRPRKKPLIARQRKTPVRNVAPPAKGETQTGSQDRYQLGQKRQPRHKCGSRALRDCVLILAVNENREVPIGARGVPPEGRQGADCVHRIVVRAEKSFAGVERTDNYSAEVIIQQIAVFGVAKALCPRFKEWTNDGKGQEFTLATVIPLFSLT